MQDFHAPIRHRAFIPVAQYWMIASFSGGSHPDSPHSFTRDSASSPADEAAPDGRSPSRWSCLLPSRSSLTLILIPTSLLAIGTGGFSALEPDWTVLDCLYFSIVALSGVGYGCITPSSFHSRRFCFIYLLLGVPAFPVTTSLLLDPAYACVHRMVMGPVKRLAVAVLERTGAAQTLLRDDPLRPPPVAFYLLRGVMSTYLLNTLLCSLAALPILLFEGGEFGDSLRPNGDQQLQMLSATYFTFVTASTVGFGDVCPVSQAARAYTLVVVVCGVAAMGHLISKLGSDYAEWQRLTVRAGQLRRQLDAALIQGLDTTGRGIAAWSKSALGEAMAVHQRLL